jgi:hypothetical protein
MISNADRLMAYIHPVIGLVALALLLRAASFGLRSRERRGEAFRPQHARAAPVAYGVTLLAFFMGIFSTWRWRPDLDIASGWHFRIGVAVILLLSAGALLSRGIPTDPRARMLHPIIGMVALLLAALQVFFGMPLLRF